MCIRDRLGNYRAYGSVVSAWGAAWLFGFAAQQFFPALAGWVWILGWIGALGWTVTRPRRRHDGKALATWFILIGYIALLLAILGPDERTISLIFALVLSASYAVMGVWVGKRFFLLAGLVVAAICFGWLWMPNWLFAALALGGGGATIVCGIWLARP